MTCVPVPYDVNECERRKLFVKFQKLTRRNHNETKKLAAWLSSMLLSAEDGLHMLKAFRRSTMILHIESIMPKAILDHRDL